MKDETKCLHSGYKPNNSEPRVLPIVQSTTYVFDSTQDVADVFDDPTKALIYSRFANPTVMAVEDKIADLEGGIAAMCTSSGQAANLFAVLNICKAGEHILSVAQIYGGTYNLFNVTLKKLGIDCTFVSTDASSEEIEKNIQPNTRLIFGETIANPAISVLDIEKFADIAHKHNIPLIVDNTFATPMLCKPIEFGADIVTHSTTKYMDGHGVAVGGAIVDGGTFDWMAHKDKFPGLTEPDPSYHGLVYAQAFGQGGAYITKATVQLMRDLGAIQSPQNAFYLNLGLESLHVRMAQHCKNGQAVAEALAANERVEWVRYPGLPTDPYFELGKKYLPQGSCGVVSVGIAGGREAAEKFLGNLKIFRIETHVADARSCALHPASSTHRQLSDEELIGAGITPNTVRLSCGIEGTQDLVADVEQALAAL